MSVIGLNINLLISFSSSQLSESEAKAYREKLLKDVDTLNEKLDKQRLRQERNLHDRLTLMKQRKLQEKVGNCQLYVLITYVPLQIV